MPTWSIIAITKLSCDTVSLQRLEDVGRSDVSVLSYPDDESESLPEDELSSTAIRSAHVPLLLFLGNLATEKQGLSSPILKCKTKVSMFNAKVATYHRKLACGVESSTLRLWREPLFLITAFKQSNPPIYIWIDQQ